MTSQTGIVEAETTLAKLSAVINLERKTTHQLLTLDPMTPAQQSIEGRWASRQGSAWWESGSPGPPDKRRAVRERRLDFLSFLESPIGGAHKWEQPRTVCVVRPWAGEQRTATAENCDGAVK